MYGTICACKPCLFFSTCTTLTMSGGQKSVSKRTGQIIVFGEEPKRETAFVERKRSVYDVCVYVSRSPRHKLVCLWKLSACAAVCIQRSPTATKIYVRSLVRYVRSSVLFLPLRTPRHRRVWKVLDICSPDTTRTTCTSTFFSVLCGTWRRRNHPVPGDKKTGLVINYTLVERTFVKNPSENSRTVSDACVTGLFVRF